MFSGLVEQTGSVLELTKDNRLIVKKPAGFNNLQTGDSLSVNGVCLTLESFSDEVMTFALGPETLKITNWRAESLKNRSLNLERSLSLQSALGGQLLTGHAEGLALVKRVSKKEGCLLVQVQMLKPFKKFFWKKGYIALNGASLTINKAEKGLLELCLIPETLKRTNLSQIKEGDELIFESDYMSKAFVEALHNSLAGNIFMNNSPISKFLQFAALAAAVYFAGSLIALIFF